MSDPKRTSPFTIISTACAVLVLAVSLEFAGCGSQPHSVSHGDGALAEYAGWYAANPLLLARVEAHDSLLSIVMPFWTGKPYFARGEGETFLMSLPAPEFDRNVSFQRGAQDAVHSLTSNGVDSRVDGRTFRRVTSEESSPALLFLDHQPDRAARLALADSSLSSNDLCDFASATLSRYPTRHADTRRFLETIVETDSTNAVAHALLAQALVATGDRDSAVSESLHALELDADNELARTVARRLRFTEPEPGMGYRSVLPFRLDAAFALPDDSEIQAAGAIARSRDLSVDKARLYSRHELYVDDTPFEVRVYQHLVHGQTHYGAAFLPKQLSTDAKNPIVIDARGVNPTYSPRNVTEGTTTLRALGNRRNDFIFLVPSFRGETLIVGDSTFVSSGDPSDAWDGATDDAIAFLNVAIQSIPEADSSRIAIVGYSRGGTVALLAGERDSRISLVLSVSGPVDHFVAQDPHEGWASWEIIADAMRNGQIPEPTEEGGQDFDHFLDRVVTDGETVAEARSRMINSSPIYFVDSLPETHAYYGDEDRSVPFRNANVLREALSRPKFSNERYSVTIFEGRGHDTDPLRVQAATTDQLLTWATASKNTDN